MPIKIETSASQHQSKLRALLGGLICAGLSVGGFYIAFSGAEVTGGIPFIPDTVNQVIGSIVFAIGACITGALALYAFYTIFNSAEKRNCSDRITPGKKYQNEIKS